MKKLCRMKLDCFATKKWQKNAPTQGWPLNQNGALPGFCHSQRPVVDCGDVGEGSIGTG